MLALMVSRINEMEDLRGKRCLITGASKGIGLACARALAAEGAHVTLMARSEDGLKRECAKIQADNGSADYLACDLMRHEDCASLVSEREYDVLVNSAGMARHAPFLDVQTEDYRAVMALNLEAMFFMTQRIAKKMIEKSISGSIINISSQMGHVGGPDRTVYCASKHGVEGFTKAASLELGAYGIRVNTIAPTFIETDLTRNALQQEAFKHWVDERIKLGRLATTGDICGPCVFLASEASAMVTGTSIRVDGGWTAG